MQRHQIIGATFFGFLLVGVLLYIFAQGGSVGVLQYNIASVFAALCAGFLAYFISGSLGLTGNLPGGMGGLKVESAGGLAVFFLVITLFFTNQPPQGQTIKGTLYTGTPEKPLDAAEGAKVYLAGLQREPVPTGKGGAFLFSDVPPPLPKLQFEYEGSALTPPVPLSKDNNYYLGKVPLEWKSQTDFQLESAGGSPPTYVVKVTVKRTGEPKSLDGLDLKMILAEDVGNLKTATIRYPGATLGESDEKSIRWVLPISGMSILNARINFQIQGQAARTPLERDQIGIRYRFRTGLP